MMTPQFTRICSILVVGIGIFSLAGKAQALPEKQVRLLVDQAREFERQYNWERARETYELLLGQDDPGLKIRERYHHAVRRCWQQRRHQDPSFQKEVLTVDYGQALKLCNIINKTMLDGAVDKRRLDSSKLFRKGIEELDAALADPAFLSQHIPAENLGEVPAFRAAMMRTWGSLDKMSREDAIKQIGQIAMAAEARLGLNATTTVMEFSCGACYAVDDYTVYLTPNQLRELAQSVSRTEAVGVGLTITIRDNRIVVHDVRVGGPAWKAGIKQDNQIVRVDKRAVVDLPLHTVNELLEGAAGSNVEIEYLSGMGMLVETALIQREAVITNDAYSLDRETSVGYLKISGFTDATPAYVDSALADMANMKGLILDLRQNNGGNFLSAIDVAQRFLEKGIIASLQHQDSKLSVVYRAKNPNAVSVPMILLIDNDTASAAEVLAGAIKENDRAILIGQTSFGKGCTQAVLKLPKTAGNIPTGGMKLTVARFYSPKGIAYSGRGIVPHILIDDRDGMSQVGMMRDASHRRAIDEMSRILMMQK